MAAALCADGCTDDPTAAAQVADFVVSLVLGSASMHGVSGWGCQARRVKIRDVPARIR